MCHSGMIAALTGAARAHRAPWPHRLQDDGVASGLHVATPPPGSNGWRGLGRGCRFAAAVCSDMANDSRAVSRKDEQETARRPYLSRLLAQRSHRNGGAPIAARPAGRDGSPCRSPGASCAPASTRAGLRRQRAEPDRQSLALAGLRRRRASPRGRNPEIVGQAAQGLTLRDAQDGDLRQLQTWALTWRCARWRRVPRPSCRRVPAGTTSRNGMASAAWPSSAGGEVEIKAKPGKFSLARFFLELCGQFARAEAARLRARWGTDDRAPWRSSPSMPYKLACIRAGKPHPAPVAGDAGDVRGLRLLARDARQTSADAPFVERRAAPLRRSLPTTTAVGSRLAAHAVHASLEAARRWLRGKIDPSDGARRQAGPTCPICPASAPPRRSNPAHGGLRGRRLSL